MVVQMAFRLTKQRANMDSTVDSTLLTSVNAVKPIRDEWLSITK